MKKHQKVRRADAALVIQNRNSFRRNSPRWRKALAWAVTAWTLGMAPTAYANPVLDSKDAAVAIAGLGTANVAISSSETNNLIKWVDFSIASGEKVAFDANNYLNYVTGHARSDILGTLTGGGNIYLVNPNGILIGDGAVINVGSLHLSTRALTDAQLASYTAATNALFKKDNAAVGDVINLGQLNANTITVEGKNITFKNVEDVTKGGVLGDDGKISGGRKLTSEVKLYADSSGNSIRIGSDSGGILQYDFQSGNAGGYRLISKPQQLQAMQSGSYMLKNDINMTGVNFTPITGGSNGFVGHFDGLGYKIQNLSINQANGNISSVGLFAQNKGVIENVGLEGGIVRATSNDCSVGGIVGKNEGTVRNVWSAAAVTGTGENAAVGGIVGYNGGTVDRAYNTGTVTGGTNTANGGFYGTGGVVGIIGGGTVSQVFNTGTVHAGENTYAGGVVGYIISSTAKLLDAYNAGTVDRGGGGSNIGGVVGFLKQGIVTNVYNSGSVTGGPSDNVGGILGYRGGQFIQGDVLNNGYTTAGCPAIGGGCSTTGASMLQYINQETSYVGFDFSENGVWRIYENNTMPLLTAFLTKKDYDKGATVYSGTETTGDVGTTFAETTTYNGVQAQLGGVNYIRDFTRITPKPLTVSFGNISKTYDGTTNATAAGTATLDGKIDGDDVSLNTANLAYAYADKNAGTGNKTVNYTGIALSGEKAKNYNLTSTTYDNTTSTISKADITVSVGDITKTYDGTTKTDDTTDATGGAFTVTSGTLYDGDTISGTKAFDTKDAGTGNKTVTLSDVTISDAAGNAGNYNISCVNNTTSTINKAPLTVTFGTTAKNYDGTTTATLPATYTLNGKVDLATENVDIIPENLSIAYADKNAGDGKIVNYSGIALTGTTAGNYALTSTTATGFGSIHKVIVNASFDPTTKVYDGTTAAPLGAASLTNIIADDLGKVGVTGTAAFTDDQNAGSNKPVSYSGLALTGTEAGNYQLANSTFGGTGSITRRPLWLVANPVTITEGEATPTSWSGSVTGFVAGEGLGANDVYFFALDNPAATAAGKYAVTGKLNGAANGDYGQNYTFANAAGNATAFTIEVKSMTPQEIVSDNVSDPGAAQEYTGTVTAIESDKQETAVLPQVQAANGMPVMAEGRTVVQGAGVNMPKSMSVEALATSLNGGATQQGNAEAATNGPATEPTASNGAEADDEEA